MFELKFNPTPFQKKVLAISMFFRNIHKDAAAFLQMKLRGEILNLPKTATPGEAQGNSYIRRLTGMLARSISLKVGDAQTIIWVNISIAPYAIKVAEFSVQRYGANYLDLAIRLYGAYVNDTIRKGFAEVIRAANSDANYQYQNPFAAR